MTIYSLVFTSGEQPISRAVRWFTWSPYSHVAIINNETGEGWESITGSGVRLTNLPRVLRSADKHTIRYIDANSSLEDFLNKQIGKKYDYGAIFGFVFRKNWQAKDKWFCSELIAEAFSSVNNPILAKISWRVTPGNLLASPKLSVYPPVGIIGEYE